MTPVSQSTSRFYERSLGSLTTLNARAERLMTEASTLKKVQSPADDVVGYRRLETMSRDTANAGAWDNNLDLAGSVLKQGGTTLTTMTGQIQRARELMLAASNGTFTAEDRKINGAELEEVLNSLVQLANTGDTRGQPLFGGTDGAPAVTIAANVVTYSKGTPSAVPVGDGQSVQANELASRLFDLGGGKDTLAVLRDLADKLKSGDPLTAVENDQAIADLAAADDQLQTVRTSLGARESRVEILQTQSKELATDREMERSKIEDVDFTSAVMELQKTMMALQTTQASFSKLSNLSLFEYLR